MKTPRSAEKRAQPPSPGNARQAVGGATAHAHLAEQRTGLRAPPSSGEVPAGRNQPAEERVRAARAVFALARPYAEFVQEDLWRPRTRGGDLQKNGKLLR